MQRTLSIIKPDATERNLIGAIVKMIEEAGLRGTRLGGMAFSPVHANFLVNEGGGTFEQAMELIELAREKVRARSGHELELEVRLWP